MLRNVRFFRLHGPWPESEQSLSGKLEAAAFRPCGPYAERSAGWEAPGGDPEGALCRRIENADLLRLRTQARLVPAAAVEDALEARLDEFRARTGEEPSRRDKRKLREQTRDALLPKAFVRSQRTTGFVMISERIVGIDSLSDSRAEDFLERLRFPLGSLDVAPLGFRNPTGNLLMRIFLGDAPRGFALGNECRMSDPADGKTSIRFTEVDLTAASVRRHVTEGMHLTHLGIEFDAVMRCTLDHNGTVSKLRLIGMDVEEDAAVESPLARLDAEFALLAGTLRRFLRALDQALGGYDEPAAPARLMAVRAG